MTNNIFQHLVILGLLLASRCVFAHGDFEPQLGVEAELSFALSHRGSGTSDDVLWHVPGAFMGGEAHGTESGLSIDELAFSFDYGALSDANFHLEVASHGHGQVKKVELEEVYVGQYWGLDSLEMRAEIGQMKASFSEANTAHPSDRAYLGQNLVYDVLLGRHYLDTGVRVLFLNQSEAHQAWYFGVELWQANSFPFSQEHDLAADLFLYRESQFTLLNRPARANLGAWLLFGEASNRQDDRYDSGHSHGTTVQNSSEITFDGDVMLSGLHADVSWHWSQELSIKLSSEYLYMTQKGELYDDSRLAQIDADHQGAWFQAGLQKLKHAVSLRYSWLGLESTVRGSGAELLVEDAELRAEEDPYRLDFAYAYQIMKGFKLRVEYQVDHSRAETLESVLFGLSFKQSF